MLVYATANDLTTWIGGAPPVNAIALLRSASILVRRATMTAVYDVDATGLATDPALLAAFADATCAQVATWLALNVDPAKGAVGAGYVVSAKSIGSASIAYAVSPAAAQARADAAVTLCQEALLILADAGLGTASPGMLG